MLAKDGHHYNGDFLLGVVMNTMSRSVTERATMGPVAAVIATACVLVARGPCWQTAGSGQGITGISSD